MNSMIASRNEAMKSRKRSSEGMSGGGGGGRGASSKKTAALFLQQQDDDDAEDLFNGKDISTVIEYEPMSLKQVSGQLSVVHDPDCAGCTWRFGKPLNPSEFPRMALVWACFYENLGKLSDSGLYQVIHDIWEKLFVTPFEKAPPEIKAKLPGSWPVDKIKAHLQDHCVFMEVELDKDFNDLRSYCTFIKQHLGKKDVASGKILYDETAAKLWFTALDKKQNTWRMLMTERRR